jgi:hypothetical protein
VNDHRSEPFVNGDHVSVLEIEGYNVEVTRFYDVAGTRWVFEFRLIDWSPPILIAIEVRSGVSWGSAIFTLYPESAEVSACLLPGLLGVARMKVENQARIDGAIVD